MWADDAVYRPISSYYVGDKIFLMRKKQKKVNFATNKICLYGVLRNTKISIELPFFQIFSTISIEISANSSFLALHIGQIYGGSSLNTV